MPIVRIDLPHDFADREKLENVRQAVKEAVLKTLSPKDARHDYVIVGEAIGKIGDGLPLVTVSMRPGREPERKEQFCQLTCDVLEQELGIDRQTVFVLFLESDPINFFVGDGFLVDWEPGSH